MLTSTTSALLYLDGVTVSFDGFRALNQLSLVIEPGETIVMEDGTYPLAPGAYTAVGWVDDEAVTDEVPFTIEACPTNPTPTPTPNTPTDTPNMPTPPPTDTAPTSGGSNGSSLPALLIILLAVSGGVFTATELARRKR